MSHYVYVPLTAEKRFLVFMMNSQSGELHLLQDINLSSEPWQLCIDPKQEYLYQQVRDKGFSGVMSFRINKKTGRITQIGEIELPEDACYVATDRSGKFLLAAYLIPGMVTVSQIDKNGVVQDSLVDQKLTDIYAHCIRTDKSNRYAFVSHVHPTNVIHQFLFDSDRGILTPNDIPKIPTDINYGPRHFTFHPQLDIVYFNEEQSSTIGVYQLDSGNGTLIFLERLSTLPEGLVEQKNSTGQVHIHPSGNYVYVSNRGHDSIAMFAVDRKTGKLTSLGQEPSEEVPRAFGIDPSGKFLFAGSDHSGRLVLYRINKQGILSPIKVYDLGMWPSWVLPVAFD